MACSAGEITVDGSELLSSIRIGVRMPRMFGLRMWVATRLFELAGLVSGMNVVVEIDDEDPSAFTLPAGYSFTPLCEHDDPDGAVSDQQETGAVQDQS